MTVDAAPLTAENFFPDSSPFEIGLLEFATLTVLIEVPIFFLCGWRKFSDCAFFAGVNVISNLLLNEFLQATTAEYWQIIFPCEFFVVLLEFVLCSYRFGMSKKIFATLLLTNAASFFIGLVLEFWEVI